MLAFLALLMAVACSAESELTDAPPPGEAVASGPALQPGPAVTATSVRPHEAPRTESEAAAIAPANAGPSAPDAAVVRRVEVTVVDADGVVLPDAVVSAFESPARPEVTGAAFFDEDPVWGEPFGRWTTAGDGRALLALPDSEVLVMAKGPDGERSGVRTLPVVDTERDVFRVRLPVATPAVIRGRVFTQGGEPAAGATVSFRMMGPVRLFPAIRGCLPRPLRSDGDGYFSTPVARGTTGFVQARLGEERSLDTYFGVSSRITDVDLRLIGGYAVSGIVLGPDGAPVPGVTVGSAGYVDRAEPDTSDGEGRFRVALSDPGRVGLFASAAGWVQAHPVVALVDDASPVAQVEIPVVPTATLAGRVVWSDGSLVGDATLFAHPIERNAAGRVLDALDADTAWNERATEDESDFFESLVQSANVDDQGHFLIEGLHPDLPLSVRCYAGASGGARETQSTRPGSTDVVISLDRRAPSADRLIGRVVDDETGEPVEAYDLAWGPWLPFGGFIDVGLGLLPVDDPDGRFTIEGLTPGESRGLEVRAIGYAPRRFGPMRPGREQDVELRIGRPAALSVRVVDEHGAPVPNATVQLLADGLEASRGLTGPTGTEGTLAIRTVGPDGLLSWPGLEPADYLLEAVAEGRRSPPESVSLEAGRTTAVALAVRESPGNAVLMVHAKRVDGRAWRDARVVATAVVASFLAPFARPSAFVGDTDADGDVRLTGLEPGNYGVQVSWPDTSWTTDAWVDVAPGTITALTVVEELVP